MPQERITGPQERIPGPQERNPGSSDWQVLSCDHLLLVWHSAEHMSQSELSGIRSWMTWNSLLTGDGIRSWKMEMD